MELPNINSRHPPLCPTCKNISLSYLCKICLRAYTSYSGAHKHAKDQCQPTREKYYCNDCHFWSKNANVLLSHLHKVHPDHQTINKKCEKCDAQFVNLESLTNHMLQCKPKFLKCKYCHYVVEFSRQMISHLNTQHASRFKSVDKIMAKIINSNISLSGQ